MSFFNTDSIFKSEHRSHRGMWAILCGFLFRRPCRSYIAQYMDERHECELRRGHPRKHQSKQGLHWGLGDNWLECQD